MSGVGKKVVVIVRSSPLNSLKSLEAFRLSVGLTLEGNRVKIVLMGEGALNALPLHSGRVKRPDMEQFISTLELCGIQAFVETEALSEEYLSKVRVDFKKKSRPELLAMIRQAEVVIPY